MKLYMFSDSSPVHHRLFTVHSAMVYVIQVCTQTRMELCSILVLLESCLQTCMTYTIADCGQNATLFHPDPARKLSTNLYDIYHCWVYSE